MARCSVCGREFPEKQLIRWGNAGRFTVRNVQRRDPTIKELGACPDCEEVFEAEEDYWGMGVGRGMMNTTFRFQIFQEP